MITTKELQKWARATSRFQKKALENAIKYAGKEMMATYYMHLATIAGAQFSLLERLIRQSEENEGGTK